MSETCVFRVDGGDVIGLGHVMRCLLLAKAMTKKGYNCLFLMVRHRGGFEKTVELAGYSVITRAIQQSHPVDKDHKSWLGGSPDHDAEWVNGVIESLVGKVILIVDHYSIDCEWESQFTSNFLVVIDDLCDRAHQCDVLIDSAFGREVSDYQALTGGNTKLLLGTDYCLLRKEFLKMRDASFEKRENTEKIETILISYGGSDPDNLSEEVLSIILQSSFCGKVIVVATDQFKNLDELIAIAKKYEQVSLEVNADNMAELIFNSDLAFGSPGGSAWERCVLGLPTVTTAVAENQKFILQGLNNRGCIFLVEKDQIREFIYEKMSSQNFIEEWKRVFKKAFNICDGRGLNRVLDEIEKAL